MLRFFNSDVWRIDYGLVARDKLLSYFLSGHVDGIICVYNGVSADRFLGIVTYDSLLSEVSIDEAIIKDYVVLNYELWENAREILKKRIQNVQTVTPLPILSEDGQLICFAYQDEDANREIRMLRELNETQGALPFGEVFPEYKCVKIHGFNELAYLFAEYLMKQKIPVQVDDEMWKFFLKGEESQVLEHECLHIYAEGTWGKPHNWKENLLRSVSVEFECVDKIYEANIKSNLIKNAETGCEELLRWLRKGKEIILCGIGIQSQDAYDFLLVNEIEICCFVSDETDNGYIHRLFGKKIIGLSEAMCLYRNSVFIDCESKNSAWGLGSVDYFDYMGYKRNEGYIMLRDYIEVSGNNLLNALGNMEVVLTGDRYLCGRLYEYLMRNKVPVIGYLKILLEDSQPAEVPEISTDSLDQEVMCLVVVPMYWSDVIDGVVGEEEWKKCITWLKEREIDNYTDYFSDMVSFINMEKDNNIKYQRECLKPKRIVLGSVFGYSGNVFFRSLLDSHPIILSIHYCDLNYQLFWTCIRLSGESAKDILPLFWKLSEGDKWSITDRSAFIEKMEQLLAYGDQFTSQELFVMFHIAYMYMHRKDLFEDDMRNMIIYWEPHYMPEDKLWEVEECVKWLGTEEVHCDIINVVRDSVIMKGSSLKASGAIARGVKRAYSRTVLRCMPIEKKRYEGHDRMAVKFEDLKCNPKETLERICDGWGMAWSDTLLQTTQHGRQGVVYYNGIQNISGFDLGPVYNTYENFFSEFDRFRLMLIDAPWRKKYGYPYVEPDQFTRRELQEMFLKEFRFESPGDSTGFYKGSLDLDDRIELQNEIRRRIQETRCLMKVYF